MGKSVEFYFDFGSPTAYLAWKRLPEIAARTGATIAYRPFLLGGVFKATGNQSPVMIPAKAKWMNGDLQLWARRHGVPLEMNPHFPINTITLMRGAHAAIALDCLRPYGEALYDAMWRKPVNLGELEVVRAVLEEASLPAAEILSRAETPEVKDALKRVTQEAVDRGAFGAPTLFVGDRMFFGQDRLEFVEEALRG